MFSKDFIGVNILRSKISNSKGNGLFFLRSVQLFSANDYITRQNLKCLNKIEGANWIYFCSDCPKKIEAEIEKKKKKKKQVTVQANIRMNEIPIHGFKLAKIASG